MKTEVDSLDLRFRIFLSSLDGKHESDARKKEIYSCRRLFSFPLPSLLNLNAEDEFSLDPSSGTLKNLRKTSVFPLPTLLLNIIPLQLPLRCHLWILRRL